LRANIKHCVTTVNGKRLCVLCTQCCQFLCPFLIALSVFSNVYFRTLGFYSSFLTVYCCNTMLDISTQLCTLQALFKLWLNVWLKISETVNGKKGRIETQCSKINVREYWKGNQKWTEKLATLGAQDTKSRQTKQKHNTICVGHHYTQTNTNNIRKSVHPNILRHQKWTLICRNIYFSK
jgi:hypothetical protein